MTWLFANWRLVLGAVLAIGTFAAGYMTGSESVKREWEVDIHLRAKEQLAAIQKNQKLITTLQEQKNANLQTVNDLRRQLADTRLRLPKTPCPGSLPNPTSGGQVQTSGAGELPDPTQAAFDGFTKGLGELMFEADTTTEQCRVVMDWARGLGK